MLKWLGTTFLLMLAAIPSLATEVPLICFGNEPPWRLDLIGPTRARLTPPERAPIGLKGRVTRIDVLKEWTWRGKRISGSGGDVVAFLRETPCSDGMSDTTHPVVARVSLPDGGLLVGCCRVAPSHGALPPAATRAALLCDRGVPREGSEAAKKTRREKDAQCAHAPT